MNWSLILKVISTFATLIGLPKKIEDAIEWATKHEQLAGSKQQIIDAYHDLRKMKRFNDWLQKNYSEDEIYRMDRVTAKDIQSGKWTNNPVDTVASASKSLTMTKPKSISYNPKQKTYANGGRDFMPAKFVGRNDPSWYTKYRALADAGSGINFLQPTGTYVREWYKNGTIGIPRVAGIRLCLTKGSSNNSISFVEWYTLIRAANSGSRNYNASDIDHYVWNYRYLLAIYSLGRRAYSLARKFEATDYTIPIAYFTAMGLDHASFVQNLANFRVWLNNFALQLQTFAPRKIALFERTLSLFDNIYTDGSEDKAQEYVFTLSPQGCEYFQYGTNTFVSNPVTTFDNAVGASGMPYSTFISAAEAALSNFVGYSLNPVIAGDMLKTWGTNGILHLDAIDENYETWKGYDPEILMQIENAVIVGYGTGTSITHSLDANSFITTRITDSSWPFDSRKSVYDPYSHVMLNLPDDTTNEAMRFVATRFSATTNELANYVVEFSGFGTEVITDIAIPYKASGSTKPGSLDVLHYSEVEIAIDTTALSSSGLFQFMIKTAMWTVFDWMPRMWNTVIFQTSGGTTSFDSRAPLFDVKKFGIGDPDALKFIAMAVERSLYSVIDVATTEKELDAAPTVELAKQERKKAEKSSYRYKKSGSRNNTSKERDEKKKSAK